MRRAAVESLRPVLAGALALLLAGAAAAKSTDRTQPMDIAADHTDAVLTDDGDTHLSGGVTITQGTLKVDADDALVTRKGGDPEEVVLTGNPARLTQVNDNGERMTAKAARIVYTMSTDLIVMTGDVLVEQPRGNLRGQRIQYDLTTGRLDGGGGGGRIQMRIVPKKAGTN